MKTGMDKLDNLVFVAYGVVAVIVWARSLVRHTPTTKAGKTLAVIAIMALAIQAALQMMYVMSIRVPNGWYETSAHFLSVALASIVISMSTRRDA